MKRKIENCPFCGSKAKVFETYGSGFYIHCQNKQGKCNAFISCCNTNVEAIEQWNRRWCPLEKEYQ